ncbi:hypothetical protein Syun_011875 [Stephania yunnanensis]|uniref:DUF632 domain-containing protein n=1 Tax=Stephania yunnanensis TaxID=152371 RepID=A0AAP0JZD7_9MAGN
MGCTQSKIENEEAVSRCKDRKQLMKDAVATRNAFAAAHSAYSMALKNTGAALSDYAPGEVPHSHPHHHHHHHNHHAPPPPPPLGPVQAPYETLPPPPPLPDFSPAPPTPIKRAYTLPAEFSISTPSTPPQPIREEDGEDGNAVEPEEEEEVEELEHRRRRRKNAEKEKAVPPMPPIRIHSPPQTPPLERAAPPPPPPNGGGIEWDYFFAMDENVSVEIRPPPPPESNDERVDGNGVSVGGGGGGGYNAVNGFKRSEIGGGGGGRVGEDGDGGGVGGGSEEPRTPEKVIEPEVAAKKPPAKQMLHSNTAPPETKRAAAAKAVGNVSLLQTLNDLDDHFLKASESAHEVSKMLEATRLHYHSNFADNRGHIDHSARVMRVITWNRSFRGMPNADDGTDDFDAEEYETHATVLDKLLAWEKKLYDEVKAGELMKLDYQRKVALLNKQKRRGVSTEALEKTKAAVSHLHTRYIVDMQSMDSTVSEINRLRDHQLYPKLVAVVDGMATMWETMQGHHDSQLKIVANLRYLDVPQMPMETTEHHYERTRQLCGVVQEWHSQFQKLVEHQKEYIQALNGWLKLNLIPIESSLKEKVSSPPRVTQPPIQALLHAWHENIGKLPAELAGNAIYSFTGIMNTIISHQEEEFKLKEKCEETRKEYTRKSRAFEDWYHKYMQRRTPPDEMEGERTSEDANHKDPVVERQFVVESLKKRLEEEVEAHQKHCKQVREKSLSSLKTHLPELFRAMADFALAWAEMYKNLQSITQHRNPSEPA